MLGRIGMDAAAPVVAQTIVGDAEFRQTLHGYGLVPVGGSPASFRQFLVDDAKAWSQVIRTNNISLD